MLKKTLAGIALFGALAFAGTVGAAANLTFLTVDGGTNATVAEGDSVEAKVTFDITASTDVESISWELVDSGLPQTCVNVADRIADGTFTSSFDVDTAGASEGTWDVRIRTYGDDGADVSNLCENTDLSDTALFSDRITVVDGNDDNQDDNNNTNTGGDEVSELEALVKALVAQVSCMTTGGTWTGSACTPKPAPPANTGCAALSARLVGTQDFVYNDANVRLQGFLLSEGASIPALKAGASFGYKGTQTNAALSWFKTVNSCI